MQEPLQITFRDVAPTDALRAAVERKAAELETFSGDIIGCHVVLEEPHRHRRKGRLHRCRIEITVPGDTLIVGRNPDQHGAHEDLYVAIRDAFRAARREIEDYERRRRREVKARVGPPHATVTRLFPNEDCGFLTAPDGREIYFHRNSVIGEFDRLALGMEVRFSEESGDAGPQASSVTPVGKNGHDLR